MMLHGRSALVDSNGQISFFPAWIPLLPFTIFIIMTHTICGLFVSGVHDTFLFISAPRDLQSTDMAHPFFNSSSPPSLLLERPVVTDDDGHHQKEDVCMCACISFVTKEGGAK